MSFDLETFYNLLPSVYRIRDLEQISNGLPGDVQQQQVNNGTIQLPLKALLKVIVEQTAVLEENLAQLYDDQFIETCAEWAIPYIGDLVSYRTPHNTSSQSLRSEVAHTISYRKRKGTATLLEQLVRDVTGWDAHVVEFFQLISMTQNMSLSRSDNSLVDLRKGNGEPLARLNTPFDNLIHTVDLRNISAGHGRYNIPEIGIFIWRLGSYSLTNAPAVQAAGNDGLCYFFNPLGNNTQLYTRPESADNVTQLTGPKGVAMPISQSRLASFLSDYYGPHKSILLTIAIDGNDKIIVADPTLPSGRLKSLINLGGSLNSGLDDLNKDLTSTGRLDVSKLQELQAKNEGLNNGLDDLYRSLVSIGNRDVKKLVQLINTGKDLKYGLDDLALITDLELQKLELEQLITTGDTLQKGLQTRSIDPQQLEELVTITDLGDKLIKDADGLPVLKEDGTGTTSTIREEDKEGNSIWTNIPEDKIAIDPVLGRFAFPRNSAVFLEHMGLSPEEKVFTDVRSTFYYGFSADMGGGEYHRSASFSGGQKNVKQVSSQLESIQSALAAFKDAKQDHLDGVVEIIDSGRIKGILEINAIENQRIELRAADFSRPLFVLENKTKSPEILITGDKGSQVTLNGLVFTGGTLRVSGNLDRLTLRHCTLVPGLALTVDSDPQYPLSPSLIVESAHTLIEIDHSIVGGLRVIENSLTHITNSIVDATRKDHVAYEGPTASKPGERLPGGQLHIENSTIIGKVYTVSLELASNTIFLARASQGTLPVDVKRQQEGCVRFSYVPHGSRTPRLYNCQPSEGNRSRDVEPQFTSLRYGETSYCQLQQRGPVKTQQEISGEVNVQPKIDYIVEVQQAEDEALIRQGADDEAEMGAFHDLFQPQRETNLRLRLDEYLRFTLEPGIIYIT